MVLNALVLQHMLDAEINTETTYHRHHESPLLSILEQVSSNNT